MVLRKLAVAAGMIALLCAAMTRAADFEWKAEAPEAHGMSADRLARLRDDLVALHTDALLVIRHDKVVLEWYAPAFGPDKPHGTASLAKALVGGMSLAVAMQDGRLKPGDAAARFVPAWKDDPRKSKITVGQLATHSSGLEDAEEAGVPHAKLTGWKGEFWKRESMDPFTISRDRVPVIYEPGARVSYSNPGMAMLAYAVTAAIQPGEQKDIRSLLRRRVFEPIGIGAKEWSVGYGTTYRVDGLDLVADWGGAAFTPRAVARVGRLMTRNGDWDGRRILDADVVRACVEPDAPKADRWEGDASPRPGFGWWTNRDLAWRSTPRDAYIGAGAGHQLLIVVPSLDLIVVRNGQAFGTPESNWVQVERHVLAPLMEAVIDPPYRPSAVIQGVRFDPPDAIVRKAIDSDNWPMTWADDDNLYTSYGDGEGFEPFIERKLSMGLARVEGMPPDFKGINLRSPSIERTGNGAKGPKASGMLMVDGILYLWVRNTHNSTLAWSADHGATWTWGFTFDTSFGCPTFLNFGRNYEGAPEEFVYVYSQDGPSAYEPYDGVVLARVDKRHLRDRDAYAFFTGLDTNGHPLWSQDIAKRGHVFQYPNHCERLDAAYAPGIGRYLLTVSFGHGQGWGLFDAPAPWGPWTAAFVKRDWGLGDTHGYRLPTKWMSPDGSSMWLVFSGRERGGVNYDAFCVRRMWLTLYPRE